MEFAELVGKKVLFSGAKGERIRIAGRTFAYSRGKRGTNPPFSIITVPTTQGEEFPIRPPVLVTIAYVAAGDFVGYQFTDDEGYAWLRMGMLFDQNDVVHSEFQYMPNVTEWLKIYREKAQQVNQSVAELSEIAHALDVVGSKGLSDKLTNIIASLSRNLFDMNDVVSDNCNDEE